MRDAPLPTTTPDAADLRPEALARLGAAIEGHIAEGRYTGAQVAIARHGQLAWSGVFGEADAGRPAAPDSLFLLYSNTKVITATCLWVLAEHGLVRFMDRVADHLPEFAAHGKQDVTLLQLLTHQGGFPNAVVPAEAYGDHARIRRTVCDFTLEWTPGSRVFYHPSSAHWTAAMVIEAITGRDFREAIRDLVIAPLGLQDEIFVGVPESALPRCAAMFEPVEGGRLARHADDGDARKRAGVPGGGGYASARAMAAFYQALLQGGVLDGRRILGPRTLAFVLRNWTGDRIAEQAGYPMQFSLGTYKRGPGLPASDLGSPTSPETFGHGGAGSSVCWGDPVTGVSFAYVSNARIADPWHSRRMDTIAYLAQAAIL